MWCTSCSPTSVPGTPSGTAATRGSSSSVSARATARRLRGSSSSRSRRGGVAAPRVMTVVRLTIAYDGTAFRGWARQREQRTVQGVLEAALQRFLGHTPRLAVAGRTDAGVHARGQVVSFRADEGTDVDGL